MLRVSCFNKRTLVLRHTEIAKLTDLKYIITHVNTIRSYGDKFNHAFLHFLTNSFFLSFFYSFIHSFIHSFVRLFIHSFIHRSIDFIIHSNVRSFDHTIVHLGSKCKPRSSRSQNNNSICRGFRFSKLMILLIHKYFIVRYIKGLL